MTWVDLKSIIIKINEIQTVSIYFHFIGETQIQLIELLYKQLNQVTNFYDKTRQQDHCVLELNLIFFNPILDGGGHPVPPPSFLCCGAFQIDFEDPILMDNSYFILTLVVLNVWNPKGVPKKIWSMFFEAGVKNENFKLGPIAPKFCMGL